MAKRKTSLLTTPSPTVHQRLTPSSSPSLAPTTLLSPHSLRLKPLQKTIPPSAEHSPLPIAIPQTLSPSSPCICYPRPDHQSRWHMELRSNQRTRPTKTSLTVNHKPSPLTTALPITTVLSLKAPSPSTFTGSNDAPVATFSATQSVTEGSVAFIGQLAATDADNSDSLTFSAVNNIDGLTINPDGSFSFDASVDAYISPSAGETQDITVDYSRLRWHDLSD